MKNGRAPILLIEDDEAIQGAIQDALAMEGHTVLTAPHGGVALELLARQPVSLILLDIKMPVMDGWAFARAYRQQAARPAPIVVLTAARDSAQWAREVDAAAYLAKPFGLDELYELVDRYAA